MAVAAHRKDQWLDLEPHNLITPAGMYRDQFPAMGTAISLLVPLRHARIASSAVRQLFGAWEATLSRFRPDSELSILNRHAGSDVKVSPLLWQVLTTALEAARATDGLYDPTMLPQLLSLGYDRSFENLPEMMEDSAGAHIPGGHWRAIQLDESQHRVTLPAGAGLDFGGIAKGMAVDAALVCLQNLDVSVALVNAGGDLAISGLPPDADSWSIEAPGRHGHWTLPLQRGALVTSGVSRRHWQQGEEQRHHLLDPRSGLPARSGLWSVTVVAARCVQAEVAATAAFVLGATQGARFLNEHGLAGLLVQESGEWHTAGPWPAMRTSDPS